MKQLPCHFLLLVLAVTGCRTSKTSAPATSESRYVPISEHVYIDKYETSNLDYRSFLKSLSETGKMDEFRANLLDTAIWLKSGGEAFATYYHSHPGYNEYPVLTVRYEQAMNYCAWLTDKYNSDPKRDFKKVLFRLPTEKEWILAASGGNESYIFPWKGDWMRNKNGNYLARFRRVNDADIAIDSITKAYKVVEVKSDFAGSLADRGGYTSQVNSFWPSDAGLYNMAGNAAEMVAEKGISKGGSWLSTGYYLRNSVRQYYDGPSVTTGFRVVMEVIEK